MIGRDEYHLVRKLTGNRTRDELLVFNAVVPHFTGEDLVGLYPIGRRCGFGRLNVLQFPLTRVQSAAGDLTADCIVPLKQQWQSIAGTLANLKCYSYD